MQVIEEVNWDTVKLTVVMPLYNCEEYMKQAVESVLSQKTEFPVLLVIADDKSTDGSGKIAAEYEKQYPQKILTIYSKKNQGLLANDIRVFKHMRSDFFCVLDPDDYWVDMNFLQKAVDFLDSHPDYTAYGSNTKMLVGDSLKKNCYIATDIYEHTCNGVEDYLSGRAFVTHTTASVYRNVMFQNGVPQIMEEAVGTLAEASFRGDVDRYVMHLKYGKAKFVNDWVGVYRIHENGICQGKTMFNWQLMNARAEIDYSRFYDDIYYDKFVKRSKQIFKAVCAEIYKAGVFEDFFAMSEYDKKNFIFLMDEFSKNMEKAGQRKRYIDFKEEEIKCRRFIKNKEKRRLIFWGTGNSAEYLLGKYEITEEDITCFVDGDAKKVGTVFHGKSIISPEKLTEVGNKYVIIVSGYYEEILKKIEKERICEQEDIVNLFWYNKYIENL